MYEGLLCISLGAHRGQGRFVESFTHSQKMTDDITEAGHPSMAR